MSRITRDASPPTRANVVAAATGFLAARAPLLERAKNHTRAAGTRPPGTWDMHLHHELRLKHVKYLPGLTNALAALSQARLSSMSLTNPITGEIPTFFSAAERDEEHERLAKHTPIESEAELAGLFNQTIARWCMQTAATLEFKLDTWCPDPPIQWTIRSANSTSYAVADGYLRFASTCPEDMTEEIWNGYQPARDFFPNLAVWEFKSLQVAEDIPAEAILAVSTLPGEFRWQVCPLDETKCLLKHVHNPSVANWAAAHRNGRLTTGARRGPDVPSEILAAQGLGFGPSEPWVNESEVTDCPLETQIGALNIVQQAWSEFVQEDSSFGVIHGGSHEIICFRDRASQTLYLSDIIHPSAQDGYFAIETGLFMAILREIKQRSQLLNQTMWAWTAIYDLQPKHAQGRVPTAPRNRSKKRAARRRKSQGPTLPSR
ncbi:hypothetical protein C8F01DRAFT_748653 [Mycena amicta]|nr:hypothetical protein C8F01DRAFT_748653 [Mycena amicta]